MNLAILTFKLTRVSSPGIKSEADLGTKNNIAPKNQGSLHQVKYFIYSNQKSPADQYFLTSISKSDAPKLARRTIHLSEALQLVDATGP